ncbi:5-formyltetrahydrofolate cyclo-ligase [Brachionus plicatilis]|uniref:5-formyltetrahydrofolate cyclo-ligase n=1 Tax=Brachionus plicatilis TaxID=10195 RepID=A0A3M7S477_BRAPC|nr:5-formyltetrahydrofolate cyclo-ligase [Brachionus plicatilis]
MNPNIFLLKSNLRKLIKSALKQLSAEEKQRQTDIVLRYLESNDQFKNSKNVALYLAMKHEEIDTNQLIEKILKNESRNKRIYVPHIEFSPKDSASSDMVFYELKNFNQYQSEMNTDNKYSIRQFNDVSNLEKADETAFDLIIVPGLAFSVEKSDSAKKITRMGRGKGYYDNFLKKIPNCHTIAVGFNQQFLPLNKNIEMELPYDDKDIKINQFICENFQN